MKGLLFKTSRVVVPLLLACVAGVAQEKTVELQEDYLGIEFVLPAGFEPMPKEMVAEQYKRGTPPKYVFWQPQDDVRITLNAADTLETEKDLPAVSKLIEADFEKAFPGMRWVVRDTPTFNDVKWFRLRFVADTHRGLLDWNLYHTNWAGKFVIFGFNYPVALRAKYKDLLEKSAGSVQFTLTVVAPAAAEPKPKPRPARRRRP